MHGSATGLSVWARTHCTAVTRWQRGANASATPNLVGYLRGNASAHTPNKPLQAANQSPQHEPNETLLALTAKNFKRLIPSFLHTRPVLLCLSTTKGGREQSNLNFVRKWSTGVICTRSVIHCRQTRAGETPDAMRRQTNAAKEIIRNHPAAVVIPCLTQFKK